jgi:hypothetical protein
MITPAYALTATERVLPRLTLDFTTGVLDPRVTVTRALNTATAINSSGFVAVVNADLPRFDYDPVTLAPKGLLIEEARTNVILQSNTFTSATWTKINGGAGSAPVITANAGTSPDGTNNAYRLQANAGGTTGSDFSVMRQTFTSAAGTRSIWVRSNTGLNQTIYFSFPSGVNSITATPTWQRLWIYSATSNGNYDIGAFPANSPGSATSCDVLIFGAQFEAGAFATSYMPTVASTVTRNADTVSMTGTNFSSWFNATRGTFVAFFDVLRPSGFSCIYSANVGGTGYNESILQSAFSSTVDSYIYAGGVQQTRLLSGVINANTLVKTGMSYAAANFAIATDGTGLQTQLSGSLPTGINRLQIGATPNIDNFLNGHIVKLFWYANMTNAELVAFTK